MLICCTLTKKVSVHGFEYKVYELNLEIYATDEKVKEELKYLQSVKKLEFSETYETRFPTCLSVAPLSWMLHT